MVTATAIVAAETLVCARRAGGMQQSQSEGLNLGVIPGLGAVLTTTDGYVNPFVSAPRENGGISF